MPPPPGNRPYAAQAMLADRPEQRNQACAPASRRRVYRISSDQRTGQNHDTVRVALAKEEIKRLGDVMPVPAPVESDSSH